MQRFSRRKPGLSGVLLELNWDQEEAPLKLVRDLSRTYWFPFKLQHPGVSLGAPGGGGAHNAKDVGFGSFPIAKHKLEASASLHEVKVVQVKAPSARLPDASIAPAGAISKGPRIDLESGRKSSMFVSFPAKLDPQRPCDRPGCACTCCQP